MFEVDCRGGRCPPAKRLDGGGGALANAGVSTRMISDNEGSIWRPAGAGFSASFSSSLARRDSGGVCTLGEVLDHGFMVLCCGGGWKCAEAPPVCGGYVGLARAVTV